MRFGDYSNHTLSLSNLACTSKLFYSELDAFFKECVLHYICDLYYSKLNKSTFPAMFSETQTSDENILTKLQFRKRFPLLRQSDNEASAKKKRDAATSMWCGTLNVTLRLECQSCNNVKLKDCVLHPLATQVEHYTMIFNLLKEFKECFRELKFHSICIQINEKLCADVVITFASASTRTQFVMSGSCDLKHAPGVVLPCVSSVTEVENPVCVWHDMSVLKDTVRSDSESV